MSLPPLDDLTLAGSNGVRLHAVRCGDCTGPLVVLLHGFPEFWYGWRHQLGPLAAAGFHVVAIDQRGYNTSDKPPHVRDYNLDLLAADIDAAIVALGVERAAVVGHDWGGVVAWWLATTRPQRVSRLAVLNGPHPVVMRRALLMNPRQMLRSWYVFMLQIPRLPEWAGPRNNWADIVKVMTTSSRPGTFTPADFDRYRAAWAIPGAYSAMVNWYRAALQTRPRRPRTSRVRPPTLILWGRRDRAIVREIATACLKLCDDGRLEMFDQATHWVQHEEAERVNERLIAFLCNHTRISGGGLQ